ncbi:serine/threonine-protein kinase [Planotetraspora kaengkrachanensis]|nr:serine/threonine-protein kinase [Planotetraspora kaengkrachanensis]
MINARRHDAQRHVSTGRRPVIFALSIVWALVSLVSLGILTSAVIGSAAIRLRSGPQGIAAGAYFAMFAALVPLVGAGVLTPGSWQDTVAAWTWFLVPCVGGTAHAFILRRRVFERRATAPSSPMWAGTVPSPGPAPFRTAPLPSAAPSMRIASSSWDPWGTPASAVSHDSGQPQRLGAYTLLHKLGEGGQGEVHFGTAPDGRQVAIKVLHERFRGRTVERDTFMGEVAAAQRVPPFSTARIIDVGVEGDTAYIVSEYVEGRSLDRLVREEGPLGSDALVRLAIATSAALNAIHSAEIVHRDFKPANVLIGSDGPRVIDFGIAKALDRVTMTSGGVKGTPAFMSPEQVSGLPVGPQSDIFSWASTMFYGATGQLAFNGVTAFQVFQAVVHHQPDLHALPPSLREPMAACLNKDPQGRPTAAQLMLAIAR